MASQIYPRGYRETLISQLCNYCILYSEECVGPAFKAYAIETLTLLMCFLLYDKTAIISAGGLFLERTAGIYCKYRVSGHFIGCALLETSLK